VRIFRQLEQQVTRDRRHDHPHAVEAEELEVAERVGTDIGQVAHDLGDEKDCATVELQTAGRDEEPDRSRRAVAQKERHEDDLDHADDP
jgi:hypothetical protein